MLTRSNRFLEELDGLLLAREAVALLVVQPAQLLQNLGVVRVSVEHTLVGILGAVKVLLLFMHMTDLEPDVLFRQWRRRRVNNVLEALGVCQQAVYFEVILICDVPQDFGCTFAVACI